MSPSELLVKSELQSRNSFASHEASLGFVVAPPCDADWFRAALPAGVIVVPSGSPVAAPETMSCPFLGVAAHSGQGTKQAAKDATAIRERFGDPLLTPLLLDGESDAAGKLQRWLAEAFAKLVHAARVDAAHQRMALAALRRDYTEMEASFKGIEDYIIAQHMPPVWLAVEFPPGLGWISNGAAPQGEIVIEQSLPVSARGISAIELHVAHIHESATGKIEIGLHAGDDPSPSHVWTVDYAALKNGWNLFQFERGGAMPNVSARLVLTLKTESGTPPTISMSDTMAPEKYRPYNESEIWSTNAIALQIWKGVPGLKTPRFHDAVLPKDEKQRYGLILSPGEMRTAALLFAPSPEKLDGVNFWQKEAGVLVHPRSGGVVCACIKDVSVQELVAVRAIVNLANAKARPVNFAITAIKSGSFRENSANELFSHWVTVKPMGWGEVFSPLPRRLEGPVDILLAAKMDRDEKPDLAWALFRRIELIRSQDIGTVAVAKGAANA